MNGGKNEIKERKITKMHLQKGGKGIPAVFSDSENFINFIKAEVASDPLTLQRRL